MKRKVNTFLGVSAIRTIVVLRLYGTVVARERWDVIKLLINPSVLSIEIERRKNFFKILNIEFVLESRVRIF